jgi:transcriptional regulator with XRE-family HTH domain
LGYSIGARIEELRTALKMTRAQLAEVLGVDIRQVAAYELEGVWPSPEMASALKTAFKIELRDLYDLTSTRFIPRVSIEKRLAIRAERRETSRGRARR